MPEENKSQVTGNDITESPQRLILDQMVGMEMGGGVDAEASTRRMRP